MFAKFGTLLLIVISAVLLFSVTADAINVESVGPESSYDNYLFAGSTQYSRAEFDEPYHSVYWYVKGPGETGFGTLAAIDQGDGTSTVSTFSHTFNSGSTSGKEYEITAYVYPENGAVDWDSYTLDVWTPADEVITVPDELTITDDIKIGDSYTFTAEASSTSNNYVIDEIEVFVDGVSVLSQSFSEGETISAPVSGSLPITAGSQMGVVLKIKGPLKKAGKTLVRWIVKREFEAALVGIIEGYCQCFEDLDSLDNRPKVGYVCTNDSGSQKKTHTRRNKTLVKWSITGKSEVGETDDLGHYVFDNVPLGHDITMWLQGDDLHWHGDTLAGEELQHRICKYEEDTNVGSLGKVILGLVPTGKRYLGHNFLESPTNTYDPCDGPYPVKFTNPF